MKKVVAIILSLCLLWPVVAFGRAGGGQSSSHSTSRPSSRPPSRPSYNTPPPSRGSYQNRSYSNRPRHSERGSSSSGFVEGLVAGAAGALLAREVAEYIEKENETEWWWRPKYVALDNDRFHFMRWWKLRQVSVSGFDEYVIDMLGVSCG